VTQLQDRPRTVLRNVQRTGVSAIRDALVLSPQLRDRVRLAGRTVWFDASPAEALRMLDQLRAPLGVMRGLVGHPYASLHAPRRRLAALALASALREEDET
jgi:hypothetical protein